MNNVMVVAAHPDDETLGCGGTIFRHKDAGDKVHWLLASQVKERYGFDKAFEESKANEIKKVSDIYGFSSVHRLELPPCKFDTVPMIELVEKVGSVFNTVKPSIVYVPFSGDAHSDHRVLFGAVLGSAKTFRYPFIRAVRMMETISETDHAPAVQGLWFVPNYFVDISSYLDRKIEAMKIYKDELKDHPFPRSLENIRSAAVSRGAMAGCKFAESFMVLKEIW